MALLKLGNSPIQNWGIFEAEIGEKCLTKHTWFDAGTEESLYYAAGEIRAAQRSGKIIACLEEIAFWNKWIGLEKLKGAVESLKGTAYGRYLEEVVGWREE